MKSNLRGSFDLTGIEAPAENVAARHRNGDVAVKSTRTKGQYRGENFLGRFFIGAITPTESAASPLRALHEVQRGGGAHRGAESEGALARSN